jgi:hypothetical protein
MFEAGQGGVSRIALVVAGRVDCRARRNALHACGDGMRLPCHLG